LRRDFLESLLPHTNLMVAGFPEMIENEEILVAEACNHPGVNFMRICHSYLDGHFCPGHLQHGIDKVAALVAVATDQVTDQL
jgi:hypothetical protein